MAKFKIIESFRFNGKHYMARKRSVSLDGDVAKFALDNGLAIDPEAEKAKAKAKAEKAAKEAPENKADESAPENK